MFLSFLGKDTESKTITHDDQVITPKKVQHKIVPKRIIASEKKQKIRKRINIKEEGLTPVQEEFAEGFPAIRFIYEENCFEELRKKCELADDKGCLEKITFTTVKSDDGSIHCYNSFDDPDLGNVHYFSEYEKGFLTSHHYKIQDATFIIRLSPSGDLEYISFDMPRLEYRIDFGFEDERLVGFTYPDGFTARFNEYIEIKKEEAISKGMDKERVRREVHKLNALRDRIDFSMYFIIKHIRTLCEEYSDQRACEVFLQ